MAEGWGKHLKGEQFCFYSAGTKKHGLNPLAIKVMQESGIDISSQQSKTVDDLGDIKIDFVITVCSDAHENCPYFSCGKTIHHGFDDPPRLTEGMEDKQNVLSVYRRVRDEIKTFVSQLENYLE